MICDEVIKQVDSIKYLGVTIDKKITWSQQVDKIALKANRVWGFLYRNIKHCSSYIKNRCYKTVYTKLYVTVYNSLCVYVFVS